ncbi:MAG: type II toxin-antitoxin system RelE/ParE family toxin [Bdellovibrionales bacterium]
MHVRFSDPARADLDAVKRHIQPQNALACDRVLSAILNAAYQLESFPFLGRPGRVENTRELSVPRTPFIIVYTLADDYHIDIENIVHDRRRWP